jgi:hypothetical protein
VRPLVEADPERLMGGTAASLAEAAPEGRAFAAVHGYSMPQLLKDQRFKVALALADAGLAGTAAGRRAIASATPLQAPRRDNLTAVQRQGAR